MEYAQIAILVIILGLQLYALIEIRNFRKWLDSLDSPE